ncbi:MAG: PAS domain-containing protein [Hymenobacteraceae bacterium]|nr:PAS domain-containing protein [Hymenobacteraceae bacterium]
MPAFTPPTPPAPPDPAAPVVMQLLDCLPLALIIADASAQVLFINAAYRRIFNLADDVVVVGRPSAEVFDLIGPSFLDPDALRGAARDALANRRDIVGLRLALTGGRFTQVDATVLSDGGWLVTYRDTTTEEWAWQEAERVQQELASIARIPAQNPHPVFRVAADGQAVYCNPAAVTLRESLSPDDIASAYQQITALIGPALTSGVAQQTTLAAAARVFDAHVVPFPAEQYVNLYLVETTARHAAEVETQRQRTFYEAILDNLPADVVVLSPELRYRYLNPHAIRAPELRAWIIGHDDLEYFAYRNRAPAQAELRQQMMRQAITERQQVSWEEEAASRDGPGVRHLMRFNHPVFDAEGALQMLIGYGLDITPIREAQLTQARSEKQYRDLMEYTQALICTHDLDGRLLSVNPAGAKTLGIPAEALVGRHAFELMPPHLHGQVTEYLAKFATQREVTGILRVQTPTDGAARYLLYHNIKVEEAGAASYVIGYAQDISERIQAERATVKAKEAAEAAARARENFLASMSHEIRTPLNGVLGMAALLENRPLWADQAQYVGLIRTAGRSLLALLNDVLDMAKISSGKLELAAVPFDLSATVRETAQTQAAAAAEKGIEFTVVPLPLPMVGVLGDPQRLGQILTNLLSNAIKFTERGGVTLHARLGPTTPATLTVTFLVSDTGIGIAAAQQEKIFDEFTQAYTDTSQRFGGTGLGLAISERLVGQLGGQLVLSSAVGIGTTFGFTLTLPRTTLAPPPAEPTAIVPPPGIAGLRVLLAEDNAVNRLLVRLMLTHHGALVTEATTGAEAVARLQADTFDLVLMDIQMPEMNGLQATTAIRALPNPAHAQVPILALTANAFRSDTERYLAAGMNGCLTKPFEEAELLRVLRELARPAPVPHSAGLPRPAATTAVFPATALQLGHGDGAFVRQIVAEFLAAAPPLLARLAAAPPAEEATVAAIAHQLVPTARAFDAPAAAAALAELEAVPATDPQWDDVRAYAVQEVEELLTRLRAWTASSA